MKIDKELIEKYHSDECTPEERDAVEKWLFSSDSDEALQLPAEENKVSHKQDMWNEIAGILTEGEKEKEIEKLPQPVGKGSINASFWLGAAAASLIIGMIAIGGYLLADKKHAEGPQMVTVRNTSSIDVKYVAGSRYDIAVGTNTSAKINNLTGAIDLAGSLLISPKEDVELKVEGAKEKMSLKKGQTYIILKNNNGTDRIIIVNESNLMDLPPVIQKQIINEFKI